MAIRNATSVACGTDFVAEDLKSVDLNDTFDKIASLVNTGN